MISEGKASSTYIFTDSSRGLPGERPPGHHSRGLGPGASDGVHKTQKTASDGFPAARSRKVHGQSTGVGKCPILGILDITKNSSHLVDHIPNGWVM